MTLIIKQNDVYHLRQANWIALQTYKSKQLKYNIIKKPII